MNSQRKTIVILCIFCTLAYIALSQYKLDQQRRDSVSSYSDSGKGMSLFAAFLEKLKYGELNIYRRPLLYYEDLAKVDALAILSPRTPISEKEAETVYKFLKNGGKLILSAHDEETALRLKPILDKFVLENYYSVYKDPEFKNFKTRNLVSDIDDEVFQKGETYSFYSQVLFSHRPSCVKRKEVSCFYYSQQVERGLVFYFLGIPLHSNALINKEFNRFFAFRMARLAPKVIVDEYHHFFPTKSLSDLATDWRHSLPLYGILVGAVLFFLFSRNPNEVRRDPEPRLQSLHDVGEKLLVKHLSHPNVLRGAREKYRKYLKKRFPVWEDEIEFCYEKIQPHVNSDDKRVQVQSRDFVMLHQELIRNKKGEKQNVIRQPDRQPDL